ncbi:MAG: hypothetical protein PWP65_1619 [Clostridia bacterium]|nr:hypothetical protein [Clostridia bacterium]
MDPRMLITLIITVPAFTAIYVYLVQMAIAVEKMRLEVQEIKDALRQNQV